MSKDCFSTSEEKSLSQKLKRALNSGDVTALRRLVKGGVDVNFKFWYDSTVLHEAVTIGNLQTVELLIQYKAKVNARNKDGRTALHIATRAGRLDIVECLLKAGAHINQQTVDGQTALHIAIWKTKYDIVEMLLKAGAQVNIPDNDGWLPLHWATKRYASPAVRQLVERQSVMDRRTAKTGQTPFELAVENGDIGTIEYLLLHGAQIPPSTKRKSAVFTLMRDVHLTEQQIMDTVDFFIQNGYIIQNDQCLKLGKFQDRLTNHEKFQSWLWHRRNSIQSLTGICRSTIRRQLSVCTDGRSITKRIKLLPLPNILIELLMFNERTQKIASEPVIQSR